MAIRATCSAAMFMVIAKISKHPQCPLRDKWIKNYGVCALAAVAPLAGVLSHEPKGHGFNSQLRHKPQMWVFIPWSVYLQEATGQRFSLMSMFLSPTPSLPSLLYLK